MTTPPHADPAKLQALLESLALRVAANRQAVTQRQQAIKRRGTLKRT
jgi:hypothetical protein